MGYAFYFNLFIAMITDKDVMLLKVDYFSVITKRAIRPTIIFHLGMKEIVFLLLCSLTYQSPLKKYYLKKRKNLLSENSN